jgi:MFS superfamily sulfate permease-like transporter
MEKNKMPGFLDLISNSLKLYRKNANDFVLLGMIAFIFLIIPDLFSFVPNSFLLFIVMSILGLFFLLVSRISAIVNSAIIVQAVDDVNSGKKIHLDNLYRGAFKRFWSILFVILITGLVFIASVSLFFIPIIAVSVYLAFVMYTLILEDKRGYDALVTSFNYVRGNWWAVFGRVILL